MEQANRSSQADGRAVTPQLQLMLYMARQDPHISA